MYTNDRLITFLTSLNIHINTDLEEFAYEYNKNNKDSDIYATTGATKCCLIFKDESFVIKWSGFTGFEDITNLKTGEIYDEALEEVYIYNKAVEAGIENFFPKTELLCTINSVNFIKQEMVTCSVSEALSNMELMKKYKNIGKNVKYATILKMQEMIEMGSYTRYLDETWASMVVSIYGKAIAKKLCSFIHDNKINDLHRGNIGFKNHKPIILDFGGYHREENSYYDEDY